MGVHSGELTGRGLAYVRKSKEEAGLGPRNQLECAIARAAELGVRLDVSLETLEEMIADGVHERGDIYLDFGVSGSLLSRPGLDALLRRAKTDSGVTHIFVYDRDRLARPEDPIDAMQIENGLRRAGKTLVFRDKTLGPVKRGGLDVGDQIMSLVEYHNSGKFLVDLAERVIRCQASLARQGYWAGGRAPYGFVRMLVAPDGEIVRELQEGERVRQSGHHVSIRPKGKAKIAVLMMIFDWADMGWGIKRIAHQLNRMGIPSPDAGRYRKDKNKHRHQVSGKWAPNTVRDLLRNKAVVGVVQWGERSEGKHRRIGADGPRGLDDTDWTESGRPRVIRNPYDVRVSASASYEPLVAPAKFDRIQRRLQSQGASQRGKTRSPDPYRYPLSGRVFDASPDCGWPMYGQTIDHVPKHVCGRYKATAGASCHHNTVVVASLSRFVMQALRLERKPTRTAGRMKRQRPRLSFTGSNKTWPRSLRA